MPKTKTQKRVEAEHRQEHTNNLAPEDRLNLLESRRGNSERERAKLLHQIEKRGKVEG